MKEIKLTKGYTTKVDAEDFEYLSQWKWRADVLEHGVYAARTKQKHEGKRGTIRMHAVIMNTPKNLFTDHINRKTLDNRRCNLRVVTPRQNNLNRCADKNASSVFRGVFYYRRDKNWEAKVQINDHSIFLGRFKFEAEAALAYDRAAFIVHHKYARFNFRAPCIPIDPSLRMEKLLLYYQYYQIAQKSRVHSPQ